MSRSTTDRPARALRRRPADEGFSLVEVLVSMLIFAVITAGVVPLIVSSLQASVVSKMDTGAKNLSQQRFELVRNLPSASSTTRADPTPRDVLDIYFPRTTAPASGSVEARGTSPPSPDGRASLTTGPFYRTRWDISFNGGDYTQWVALQFLNPTTKAPLTPAGRLQRLQHDGPAGQLPRRRHRDHASGGPGRWTSSTRCTPR